MAYAESTSVSVEKSRAEIEKILTRYGAGQFGYIADTISGMAMIEFMASDRHVRFVLTLPSRGDKKFTHNSKGERPLNVATKQWEQACRSRWRALCLCIKAKLEAVESGISEFEQEFLANIVLPGGKTAGEWMLPQIQHAYDTKGAPVSLLSLPSPEKT